MNRIIVVFFSVCTALSFTMAALADDNAPYPDTTADQIDNSSPAPAQEPVIAPESYPDPEPAPMQEPATNPEPAPVPEPPPAQAHASDSEPAPPPANE
jgi:hypothetical protein